MDTIEAVMTMGLRVTLAAVGNEYRFAFTYRGHRHKGTAPSRDGAIAKAYDRIKECRTQNATQSLM